MWIYTVRFHSCDTGEFSEFSHPAFDPPRQPFRGGGGGGRPGNGGILHSKGTKKYDKNHEKKCEFWWLFVVRVLPSDWYALVRLVMTYCELKMWLQQ